MSRYPEEGRYSEELLDRIALVISSHWMNPRGSEVPGCCCGKQGIYEYSYHLSHLIMSEIDWYLATLTTKQTRNKTNRPVEDWHGKATHVTDHHEV